MRLLVLAFIFSPKVYAQLPVQTTMEVEELSATPKERSFKYEAALSIEKRTFKAVNQSELEGQDLQWLSLGVSWTHWMASLNYGQGKKSSSVGSLKITSERQEVLGNIYYAPRLNHWWTPLTFITNGFRRNSIQSQFGQATASNLGDWRYVFGLGGGMRFVILKTITTDFKLTALKPIEKLDFEWSGMTSLGVRF